jgi:hypothetical protein
VSNASHQLTAPRYVQAFACIGAKCPTTCCGGWRIQIDQATYQHWQTIRVEPLRTALSNSARFTPPEDACIAAWAALRQRGWH